MDYSKMHLAELAKLVWHEEGYLFDTNCGQNAREYLLAVLQRLLPYYCMSKTRKAYLKDCIKELKTNTKVIDFELDIQSILHMQTRHYKAKHYS